MMHVNISIVGCVHMNGTDHKSFAPLPCVWQEWKKIWGYGSHGVDPLELVFTQKRPPTFEVTTEGISLLQ